MHTANPLSLAHRNKNRSEDHACLHRAKHKTHKTIVAARKLAPILQSMTYLIVSEMASHPIHMFFATFAISASGDPVISWLRVQAMTKQPPH